jgi:RNA polymerase sigma-70 factor, ECF subfamily
VESVETRLKILMLAGLAGNAAAHRRLLEASAQRLRSYFGRRLGADAAEVEDLVQDTLVAIHSRRESYDPALPFTSWLHAIARYKLIDHLRQNKVRKQVPLDAEDEIAAPDDLEACLAAADVERLLAELPEKHRRSIRLTHIEGHSVAEAAAMTGRSESAVKVSVHRGIRRLMARVREWP